LRQRDDSQDVDDEDGSLDPEWFPLPSWLVDDADVKMDAVNADATLPAGPYVGGEVQFAEWDEAKHKRDAGKFATAEGESGGGSDPKAHSLGGIAKHAARAAWTVAQAWPKISTAIVRESGAPEGVAKAAYLFASVADWAVPGIPAGSIAVGALATLATGGRAPYRAAKSAVARWKARRGSEDRVAASESGDMTVAIARWMNGGSSESRAAVLAAMLDEYEDPEQAFAAARAFVDEEGEVSDE